MSTVDLEAKIPNNVGLRDNKRLLMALEKWQPAFLRWWKDVGPSDFNRNDIYLRTAIGVGQGGWAHFDYVKMPDYRWGIFLADPVADRKIHFGDNIGAPVWNEVPGEMRNRLRRLIVTQGDTEPASVEQQRMLGHTAPSLYDMRSLFQINVEEGRHLWAMVYLLHTHFGGDGRDEADALLDRHSGDADNPRILQAFNYPIDNWVDFFCFTTFTDRDGKYQLASLAESSFDPLARTTQFMLTEEAYHMQTGENGLGRIIKRTAELHAAGKDPQTEGAIPLEMLQRYVRHWASASMDLFGGEDSTNAAEAFASGLKGRYREGDGIYKDPKALQQSYSLEVPTSDGRIETKDIPLRRAMNAVLLDAYIADCKRIVERWNRELEKLGVSFRFSLPDHKFNRHQGVYAGFRFSPEGKLIDAATWEAHLTEWLPKQSDRDYVKSCMHPVYERGKYANYIAPPSQGANNQPVDCEYVKFN
ncbi:benzoyl-CoA oxygenase subunit B [Planctomycetota bacterium]|jgi:benzoyl-CoA 2,3-dioxygenase component B|nr:benzoyl-CoA 2,3-epoxidase subunit BoxB [Planctomycetota bacterium]MSR39124.1 benzoyl-CoA 2,3-epoxidase subunit BoxB [Planctomycetota bacterium]GDY00675.1 benzoyl-CoA oxygenase subunit B [Planctomycetota bacterium]